MFLCHCFFSTEKDWDDINFGVKNKVDYYAVSFVKDAKVVHELKDYLRSKILHLFPTTIHWFLFIIMPKFTTSHCPWRRIKVYFFFLGCGANIHVTVKIESADSIPNLHSIISASNGVSHVSCWWGRIQYPFPHLCTSLKKSMITVQLKPASETLMCLCLS